ncbi:hypothetical protein OIN60_05815 [Paenibacillus sp. P96]|uniref:Uncharacterized protein n=1 Tax=Paenibacillus zeirhizosphaerae TaxID=2987519 RepID=A0ABT9FNH1_9BACL|nr:hypothetical protein [Paenibacillus sp. P96]MDP4096286.1 hypothetical protein [Paenibacillus sp. P96]
MEKTSEESNAKFTSQLSADIWGHRFKDGQRGPEYVLEFLNVLFGANYSFSDDYYRRKKSVGLRKFIFEGVKEGSGSSGILVLEEEEKTKLLGAIQEDNIHVLKQFLRNLEVTLYNTTGKEADRSWFARSLYPLHESLLYVELRKKGKDLSFERNFYARGGELYFLMLAYGTDKHTERRQFIETRFKQLLKKNKIIEKVVDKIASAFDEDEASSDQARLRSASSSEKNVPVLPPSAPQENERLFESFAEELERLLSIDLDIYEMFHLLTALVCFQLARYMHERSYTTPGRHYYFIDCLDGTNKPISRLSSLSFEQHENLIKARFEHELELRMQQTFGNEEEIEQQLPQWKAEPEQFIDILGLNLMRSRKRTIENTLLRCNSVADVTGRLQALIREAISDQLKKHQLNITRVISRDGGFATYRRGSASNYRYSISDPFLQMIVFTKVKPKEKMEYYEFLETLYRDYGIVIGESQARQSGLYEQSRLNIRYFNDNEKALRDKLRHNGLLIEFSDATAMVQNPYAPSMMEVSYV